jgi:hypothetical protein
MFELVAAALIPFNPEDAGEHRPGSAAAQVTPGRSLDTLQSVGAGGRAPPDRGTLDPPNAPRSPFS